MCSHVRMYRYNFKKSQLYGSNFTFIFKMFKIYIQGLTWLWGWKEKKKGINHKFLTNFKASTNRIIGYINALKWMVFSYVVLQCSVINQFILRFNIKMNEWMVTPSYADKKLVGAGLTWLWGWKEKKRH